jgi:hypothetical protein
MKQITTTPEDAELEMLANVLEKAGIKCLLKNEQMSQTLPTAPFNVELWIMNDEDFPAALALCRNWVNPTPAARNGWVCVNCGQAVDGQFDSCWKCGTKREATAVAAS